MAQSAAEAISDVYVYSGKVAGELAALAGGADLQRGASYYAVIGLGFLATAFVTVLVTRVALCAK